MEPINSAIQGILEQGLLGALVVILGVAYYLKDKEVSKLRSRIEVILEERLNDANEHKNETLQITNKVGDAIAQLSSIFSLKKRKS